MKQATFLKINPADSVVVCLQPKQKGDIIEIDGLKITVNQDTPAGHKVLIKDAPQGTDIIKYGYPIGHAKTDLKAGDWVNENNLKTNLSGTLEYTYNPVNEELSIPKENRTFKGYVRKNGDVGVRNEIWVRKRLAKKVSMPSMPGIIISDVLSFQAITRTPVRCCVTSVCIRMLVPYSC